MLKFFICGFVYKWCKLYFRYDTVICKRRKLFWIEILNILRDLIKENETYSDFLNYWRTVIKKDFIRMRYDKKLLYH